MAKLAIQDISHFQVSDIEATSSETSYTIDTLNSLRRQLEGELYFLLGLDAFLDFPTWKLGNELLSATNFVVISRPEVRFSQITSLAMLPAISEHDLADLDKGTRDHL